MTYRGSGRVMLLERLPAPKDSKHRLAEMLDRYSETQEARVATMFDYAESRHCKHDMIAEHFGEPRVENCTSCDNCTGQRQPEVRTSKHARAAETSLTDSQKRRTILETVRMVSEHVGFTGLVRVLKGSIASHIKRDRCPNFGVLANEPKATVERYVRELLDDGHLDRDESEYRLISLGKKGVDYLERAVAGRSNEPAS